MLYYLISLGLFFIWVIYPGYFAFASQAHQHSLSARFGGLVLALLGLYLFINEPYFFSSKSLAFVVTSLDFGFLLILYLRQPFKTNLIQRYFSIFMIMVFLFMCILTFFELMNIRFGQFSDEETGAIVAGFMIGLLSSSIIRFDIRRNRLSSKG